MRIQAIKTTVFHPGMNLVDFILKNAKFDITENCLLAVTSKIVSLAEGQVVEKKKINKGKLVKRECEHYLGYTDCGVHLTIHQGLLLPSAGIDESNSPTNDYILYPQKPFKSAQDLRRKIKDKLSIKNFGVLLTDSRTLPLRKGVVGMALAYSGFEAVRNLIGKPDLFGRKLKMTYVNCIDPLAAAAVFLMGEGGEGCPLAIIKEAPVEFSGTSDTEEINITVEEDMYAPLYKQFIY